MSEFFRRWVEKLKKEKEQFEIEHLDPDKRSWYYDGDGTKRRKEEDGEEDS